MANSCKAYFFKLGEKNSVADIRQIKYSPPIVNADNRDAVFRRLLGMIAKRESRFVAVALPLLSDYSSTKAGSTTIFTHATLGKFYHFAKKTHACANFSLLGI
jgi:hypothetical protein